MIETRETGLGTVIVEAMQLHPTVVWVEVKTDKARTATPRIVFQTFWDKVERVEDFGPHVDAAVTLAFEHMVETRIKTKQGLELCSGQTVETLAACLCSADPDGVFERTITLTTLGYDSSVGR